MAAEVIPSGSGANSKKNDWPLIVFLLLVIIFGSLIGLKYLTDLSPKVEELVLVISLIIAVLATISAQLKFKDKVITFTVAVGFLFIASIGFGIYTPKEAITEMKDLAK